MPKTNERGLMIGVATTETGRKGFGTTTAFTETGRQNFGSLTEPWTLEIVRDGTPVATEFYQAPQLDLAWVPPADPPWGSRAGTYDYTWAPS